MIMGKEIDLPQALADPALNSVYPGVHTRIIGGMSAVADKADKGHWRRQPHMHQVTPAGSVRDHRADALFAEYFPGIPDGKPVLVPQLDDDRKIAGQPPHIFIQQPGPGGCKAVGQLQEGRAQRSAEIPHMLYEKICLRLRILELAEMTDRVGKFGTIA